MIKGLRLRYSEPALCRYLKVSESGYYSWLNRKPSKRAQEDARLAVEIKAAISAHAAYVEPRSFRKNWRTTAHMLAYAA